MPLLLLLLLI